MNATTATDVVRQFVAENATSGSHGETSISGNVLYHISNPIARRIAEREFILPSTISAVVINDALITQLALTSSKYTRVPNFLRLTGPAAREADLDNNHDNFRLMAKTFGFEYTETELSSIETAKAFRKRVKNFYTKLESDETKAKAKAEAAAMEARLVKAALGWDRGEGDARNSKVTGEGGGNRIRFNSKLKKPRLESSSGYRCGPVAGRRTWELASKHWHGGKQFERRYDHSTTRSISDRTISVNATSLSVGCQRFNKAEVERFAALMGWPKAIKA